MNLLILPAILCFALNGAITRVVQLRHPGQRPMLRAYQALFCLAAALCFGIAQLAKGVPGHVLPALGYGAAFGVFFFAAVTASSAGYEKGSMALTAIFMNLSLFIPLVYSCLVYGDVFTPVRVLGVSLIVVTVVLAASGGRGMTPLNWWFIVLGGFLANGVTAVLQKRFATLYSDGALMLFMAFAYLTASVLFAMQGRGFRKLAGLAAVSGVGSFGGNALLGILCTQVSAAVLYPCVNGGLCVVSAILSFLFFKEKLSRRKLLAIAVGVTAIVLLNL